jgi:hypothetical protein
MKAGKPIRYIPTNKNQAQKYAGKAYLFSEYPDIP